MSAIKGFIYNCRRGILTIVLLLVSFTLIVLNDTRGVISLSKIGFSLIYPFQYLFNSAGRSVEGVVNAVAEVKKIEDELEVTRRELDQYRKMLVDFNVLINENNDLRKLLELRDNLEYKSVAARIIGRDPDNLFDYIVIDKGSMAGVVENMPVISYKNGRRSFVGKVISVTPFASKVITLHNPDLRVGVVIDYDGTHCIVQGDSIGGKYARILYLPKEFDAKSSGNNLVYTSGDSVFYPKGIEVGMITDVIPSKRYNIFNEAKIEISEDYSKLEFVLVLVVDHKKDDYKLLENPF